MYRKLEDLFICIKNSIRFCLGKNYITSLEEAYYFTVRKFGHKLTLSDVHFPIEQRPLDDLRTAVSFIDSYIREQGEFNIALRCNIVCMDIHDKLKSKYNIDSIITSGDLRLNGRAIWTTTRKQLATQFGHTIPVMSHHVWLTIGEFIIDPTVLFTIRQRSPHLLSKAIYDETHMIFLCEYKYRTMYLGNLSFEYKPRLVGREFYEHTRYGTPFLSIFCRPPAAVQGGPEV